MGADREETEEELEKNERDFVRNLSCPDRFGSDADTETKHAFFVYEFGLDEDEDGDEVNGPPGEKQATDDPSEHQGAADADVVNNVLEEIIQASKKICNAHHVDPEILTKVLDNLKNSIAAQETSIPTEKRAHQERKQKRKRKLTK
ncbi:hypothetical protein P8452_14372 [Trifolium repens]|nr:hypothetical protein P8452_14372 [Trifolium repens]